MPRRITKRKRTTRRKRTGGRKRTTIRSLVSPIASHAFVKMRYSQGFSLDPSVAGSVTSWRFKANGIYDPDTDGTGHQPITRDQWAIFYTKYCVVSSKLTATFTSTTGVHATSAYNVGIALLHDNTTITDINNIKEQGNCVWKNLSFQRDLVQCSKRFSARKFLGGGNPTTDDGKCALFTADPVEAATFHVWASANDQSGQNPGVVLVDVVIEYYVKMFEPNTLPQS